MLHQKTLATFIAAASFAAGGASANGQIVQLGNVTSYVTGQSAQPKGIDYLSVQPMPLPQVNEQPASLIDNLLQGQAKRAGLSSVSARGLSPSTGNVNAGVPGFSPGNKGDGKLNPVFIQTPSNISVASVFAGSNENSSQTQMKPADYGTSNQPFTTSRTDVGGANAKNYPYSAAGKLIFNASGVSYVCSASLIKRGIVVTAAHCVANFGKKQYYSSWQFIPGYDDGGVQPYGIATAKNAYILTSYYNGTDPCYSLGVDCQDDVAVIVLNTNIGNNTGWFGYGWNGYGNTINNTNQITQLGYPVALDGGTWQERTDSQGYVNALESGNTVIGSGQSGGASGGPWLVNFGVEPTGEVTGGASNYNMVVGVTSWGWGTTVQQQGASPFTSNNIVTLVNTACTAYPSAC